MEQRLCHRHLLRRRACRSWEARYSSSLSTFLHILKPEVDVWSRMISEYTIGRHGWLMTLAFLALGAGCTAFIVAIRPSVPGNAGVAGLMLLGIAAVGLVIAGVFTTDPAAAEVELTTEGTSTSSEPDWGPGCSPAWRS